VIVATVVAGDEPVAQEQAVLEFLNGDQFGHHQEAGIRGSWRGESRRAD
jgi:hypothetical protein